MADQRQERLDELGERIDDVRHDAEEDGLLPDSTPDPTFVDPNPDGPDDDGPDIGNDQIRAAGMTDQNTTHSPRVDDQLAHESAALTHGAPDDARTEARRDQVGAEGEPEIVVDRDESDAELDARASLAAAIVPSAFPGTASALADAAEVGNASPDLVAALRSLPEGRIYEVFSEVWKDLGGEVEHLAGHARIDDHD